MRTTYHEDLVQTDVRVKIEGLAREREQYRLAQIATGNRPSAAGRARAATIASVSRLAESVSHVVRAVLTGPSRPNEECC
jgi:hypothetical protein